MLWPYFRLPKQHRRTRNRIVSMVLHSVVLVLTTLVLAGISLEVSYVDIKHDVMIVVDKSKSNESAVPRMNEFISDIIDELPSGYRVGIVEFANGNVYSATLSGDKASAYQSYLNQVQNPSTNGTDIAGALSYAHQALENPQGGRIILLSDGRETDGRALVASSSIGNTGTRIDVVYFGNAMSDTEVQIVDVKVPDFVSLGAMITISVTVQSAQPGTAVIHLTDNDQPIGNDGGHPVTLSGGLDTFIFDYSFSVARLHEIKTVVESEDDDVTENNTWYSYVFIEGSSNRILIIDGTTFQMVLQMHLRIMLK